jgi:hypothetical protein
MALSAETRTDAEIADAIDRWHTAPPLPGLRWELHEHLGWTPEQYRRWVETGAKP